MAPARGGSRRPLVSLEAQLQQLTLFSDLDADNDNLEQLGPIIKSLDQASQQDAFLRHLKNFVKEKDDEIESVCNTNHQDFVAAVDKLLKVRSGTVSLKHRIGELNEDIQAGGHSLGTKKKQLLEAQRIGQNMDDAIETLQACLRILDMANRIEGLVESNQYYAALRSLEELETIHLKPVLHHDFARLMLDSIPQTRERVRQAVTKEMKEWLYEVREKTRAVGKLALDAMESRQKRWKIKSQKDPMLSLAKVNSAIELVVNERIEYNFTDNEVVRIDFRPLYQCIHIYDVMDSREQLQANYQEDRRAQANLLLSQGLSFDPNNPTFPALLEEVVGFFIVEHHVLQTTAPGFRADHEVDDLWDTMCERVVDIVGVGLRDCRDTKVYVSTKAAIHTFIQTLESYSFSVEKLNSLLLTLFERYVHLLRDRFAADFQDAVRETQHQPMIVKNVDELSKVLNVCWLKPGDAERLRRQPFPLALPFSQTYPLCCMDIRNLVDQYYTFSDGFSQHHRDIDDILKKSLDELLVQQVSNSIRQSVEKTANLSQIAQIVVNAEHFKLACSEIEALLATLRAPHRGGKLRLDASSHFSATLDLAQRRIDSAIASKVDECLTLAEYNWTAPKIRRTREASSFLQDMLRWLTTMMESVLVILPVETKLQAYRAAFRYMGDRLLYAQVLADDETRLSPMALEDLLIDLRYLEDSARKLFEHTSPSPTPTSSLDSSLTSGAQLLDPAGSAAALFAEVHQTLSLVLASQTPGSATPVEYAQQASVRARFPAVRSPTLAILLERLYRYHVEQGTTGAEAAARRKRESELVKRLARR